MSEAEIWALGKRLACAVIYGYEDPKSLMNGLISDLRGQGKSNTDILTILHRIVDVQCEYIHLHAAFKALPHYDDPHYVLRLDWYKFLMPYPNQTKEEQNHA